VLEIRHSPFSKALTGKETDFDLRLVQPTSVARRIVNRESVPHLSADLGTKGVSERLPAVDVEVIQHEMNLRRTGVAKGELKDHLGELKAGSVRRGEGEMTASLGLYRTEDIGRSASLLLAISFGQAARTCWPRGANLGMERDWLLIHANDRFGSTIRLLIHFQDVLHLFGVLGVELRNAPHFFPATASSHGCSTTPGLFRVQLAGPAFA
jgi:hypothetical protein